MGYAAIPYIVAAVASTGSAYMAYDSSKAQQESQDEYNKSLEEEAIRQYSELDEEESDAIKESNAQSLQAQKEYMQARSTVELQAAVTGTYGNSVNTILQDLKTGYGGRMAEITNNRETELDNIDKQARNIQAGVGQNADRTIQKPAWYSAAQSGISTFSTVYGMSSAVGKASKQGARATSSKKNAEATV